MKNFDFLKHKVNTEKMGKEVKEQMDKLDAASNKAKVLLECKDFAEFREDFEVAYEDAIDMLIGFEESDPIRYKLGVQEILIRIRVLKSFIIGLERKRGNK